MVKRGSTYLRHALFIDLYGEFFGQHVCEIFGESKGARKTSLCSDGACMKKMIRVIFRILKRGSICRTDSLKQERK